MNKSHSVGRVISGDEIEGAGQTHGQNLRFD